MSFLEKSLAKIPQKEERVRKKRSGLGKKGAG
jgi:hypothetical protein